MAKFVSFGYWSLNVDAIEKVMIVPMHEDQHVDRHPELGPGDLIAIVRMASDKREYLAQEEYERIRAAAPYLPAFPANQTQRKPITGTVRKGDPDD